MLPEFSGVWRMGEQSVHFHLNGKYETSHVPPCTGGYQVIEAHAALPAKPGFVLQMTFDQEGLLKNIKVYYLIDDYSPDCAVLRPVTNQLEEPFTVTRDAALT